MTLRRFHLLDMAKANTSLKRCRGDALDNLHNFIARDDTFCRRAKKRSKLILEDYEANIQKLNEERSSNVITRVLTYHAYWVEGVDPISKVGIALLFRTRSPPVHYSLYNRHQLATILHQHEIEIGDPMLTDPTYVQRSRFRCHF